MLDAVNLYLGRKGIRISTGTIVDANIIAAPSSTKNNKKERDPPSHLRVEIVVVGGLTSQQSTREVAPHILHTRFNLAFGLCAIGQAQPRRETPAPCEVEEDGVPNNLAALIHGSPNRLHPVV